MTLPVIFFATAAALSYLEEDLRALWAVRVLDRWAARGQVPFSTLPNTGTATRDRGAWESFSCERMYFGPTPDAARIAAAEALVAEDPTLDGKAG